MLLVEDKLEHAIHFLMPNKSAYSPNLHNEHSVAPILSLAVPCGQDLHFEFPSSAAKVPSKHSVQSELPLLSLNLPLGQLIQNESFHAGAIFEKVPTAQSMQTDWFELLNVPAGNKEQPVLSLFAINPNSQFWHSELPERLLNDPVEQ